MIIPKKEILYAPMLGTLGGASAKGFGQGAGGFAAYETGLWAMGDALGQDGYGMVQYDTGNFDRLVTSTNIPCHGSYPSVMADTYRSSTGSVYLVSADSSVIQVWSSSSLNQISAKSIPGGATTRGIMVHGIYVYWADNNGSTIRKYSLNNVSSLVGVGSVSNGYGTIDFEGNVAVDGYLYFGGGQGYICVIRESDFSRMTTTRVDSNTNEITAMCYGANGALYAGYQNGDIVRFTSYQNGLNATHSTNTQAGNTIEDLEVDKFGNIHSLSRGSANAYEVFRGSDLHSITHSNLPMSIPAGIILNDYMYVADHEYAGQHYKYYVPDVVAGTFSPTNAGSRRGPTTNTLLGSYSQSELHQKNLEQGGLSF